MELEIELLTKIINKFNTEDYPICFCWCRGLKNISQMLFYIF